MKLSTLKTSSFVSYLSHLPLKEAVETCAGMQAAVEDICGDLDNWKAYVARRYGLKYSVQRPDLLTTDEWIRQAFILENLKDNSAEAIRDRNALNHYYAVVNQNGSATLHAGYEPEEIDGMNRFFISLSLPGLPIVVSDISREFTYHVVGFTMTIKMPPPYHFIPTVIPALDAKHPSRDTIMFEYSEFANRWLLESFIPYYAYYTKYGYSFNLARFDHPVPQDAGHNFNTLQEVLTELSARFNDANRPFSMIIILRKNSVEGGSHPVGSTVTAHLQYIPAKLA